jgi:hypothetical protein
MRRRQPVTLGRRRRPVAPGFLAQVDAILREREQRPATEPEDTDNQEITKENTE